MSTKLHKNHKTTKQVRIEVEIHKQLKLAAVLKNTSMSSLLDEIIKDYLDKCDSNANQYEIYSK